MAVASRGFGALRTYLEMIKIEHSIFALPFAMLGMIWAAPTGWPGWPTFGWIVLAMVSCRSAAMAYNRIADRDVDAINPRTAKRAIPAGLIRTAQVATFLAVSIALFLLSAAMLNRLALELSPIALLVTLGYSHAKRFTSLSHLWLGASLGIAPAAAYIAVRASVSVQILLIAAAVTFWTAGFDIIYSLQDAEFDRANGLHSLPARIGPANALATSRVFHVLAVACLAAAGWLQHVGPLYYCGVALAAALLAYEQSLVSPQDQSKVNLAFFNLNGYVSIGVFLFALLDRLVWHPK